MNPFEEKMPRLVAELHAHLSPLDSVIRGFRTTAGHGKLKDADYVLANPPFNDSDTALRDGAFLQSEAKPQSLPRQRDIRRALIEADLVVTALRGSAFAKSEAIPQVLSNAKNNMVALPGQLFYSTQIPVCRWFLRRDKTKLPSPTERGARGGGKQVCDRRKQTLFIDARKLGTLIDRVSFNLSNN